MSRKSYLLIGSAELSLQYHPFILSPNICILINIHNSALQYMGGGCPGRFVLRHSEYSEYSIQYLFAQGRGEGGELTREKVKERGNGSQSQD
jgi:hypothetical protein